MQPIEPAPVEYVPGVEDHDEWFAYRDAMDDYFFQTRWLKIALTPAEYAHTTDLPVALLKELYADIHQEGPMGAVWNTHLRHMIKIFNNQMPAIDAADFLAEFIATYQHGFRDVLAAAPDMWITLQELTTVDRNTRALMPDVDAYLETLPHRVRTTKVMTRLQADDPDLYFQFADALEEHAKVVLLGYLLRELPTTDPLMQTHDAFATKYGLLAPLPLS